MVTLKVSFTRKPANAGFFSVGLSGHRTATTPLRATEAPGEAAQFLVGVTGIEPMSYPPHGQILPLYYTPTKHCAAMRAHYHCAIAQK